MQKYIKHQMKSIELILPIFLFNIYNNFVLKVNMINQG